MKFSNLITFLLLSMESPVNASIRGRRKLQQLVGYGGEPNNNRFPLQMCEGDCDNDGECDDGLICFQREIPGSGQAWSEVPGCIGGREFTAQTDFCILAPVEGAEAPPTGTPTETPTETPTMVPTVAPTGAPTDQASGTPTIAVSLEEGTTMGPSTATPSMGPTTMEPTTTMPSMVPSTVDYWDLPELTYVGDNIGTQPLGLCQGDCDVDEDCLDEMVCFQRSFDEPIPGCRGSSRYSMDYCVKPPVLESVEVVTMSPTSSATMAATEMIVALQTIGDANDMPLGLCQGDCDTDDDCLDTFICFQRDALESVPGCAGQGSASYDYCIIDPFATSSPTDAATIMTTSSPTETETVVITSAPTQVPVAVSTEVPVVVAAMEESLPTMQPTMQPLLETVDYDQKDKDSTTLLGLCEGKCKEDDDCEDGLVCMDRDSEDDVPGCGGNPKGGDDYCINPPQAF